MWKLILPGCLCTLLLDLCSPVMAQANQSFAYYCTLNHAMSCLNSSTLQVELGRGQGSLKLYFTASSASAEYCVSASFSVAVDGALVYTTPLLAPGSSLNNVVIKNLQPGSHSVTLSEAGYSPAACPEPINPYIDRYSIRVDIVPSAGGGATAAAGARSMSL